VLGIVHAFLKTYPYSNVLMSLSYRNVNLAEDDIAGGAARRLPASA